MTWVTLFVHFTMWKENMMMVLCFISMSFAVPYQDTLPWWEQTTDEALQKLIRKALLDAPESQIAFEKSGTIVCNRATSETGFLAECFYGMGQTHNHKKTWGLALDCLLTDLVPDIPGMPVEEEEEEDEYTLFTSGTMSLQVNVPLDVWGKTI